MASIAPSRLASHSPAPRPKTMTSTSSRFCPQSVHSRFSVADSLSPDWASDETRVHSISPSRRSSTQIFIGSHPHQQAQQYTKDMTSRNVHTGEGQSNVATVNLQAKDSSISKLLGTVVNMFVRTHLLPGGRDVFSHNTTNIITSAFRKCRFRPPRFSRTLLRYL